MCLAMSGIILLALGCVFTITGVGAVIGIPLALLGAAFVVFGFAGALLGILFAIAKFAFFIILSPLLLVLWLARSLWRIVF